MHIHRKIEIKTNFYVTFTSRIKQNVNTYVKSHKLHKFKPNIHEVQDLEIRFTSLERINEFYIEISMQNSRSNIPKSFRHERSK